MEFNRIQPAQVSNVFDLIKDGMPLLTAEHDGVVNTMTVNWGQLGYLWRKCVSTVYVRPQRYTFPLIDASDTYSLSFLSKERYAKEIAYCGSVSGRDEDKFAHCGFTVGRDENTPYIQEADLVLICKKCYTAWLTKDGFLDPAILADSYPGNDFHKLYTGEILAVLSRKS